MRLIDADALKERFRLRINWLKKDVHDQYSLGLYHGCESDAVLVDEMSTIDPESLRPMGEWISVEEKLPEDHETVLIFCKNGAMFIGYHFVDYENDVRWRINTALGSTKLLNKGRVSHWVPLPEPPNCGAKMKGVSNAED